jgi:DNA-binding CsgD family transcriptional regulator/PAS domain-containing protein
MGKEVTPDGLIGAQNCVRSDRGEAMSRIDSDKLSELVLDIHQTALEPENWPCVMNRIADAMDACSSHLMVLNPGNGTEPLGFLERQDPEAHRIYMRDHFPRDIRVPRMTNAAIGSILRDCDVWSAEERLASPLYHDYQRVHRLHAITGANLSIAGHLIWFGLARREERPFEDDGLELLRLVLPHIRQAVRHFLERAELAAQRDVLWQLRGKALFLLDPDGRVRFCNAAAESLTGEGLLRLARGRLVFADTKLQDSLACALAALRHGTPLPAACHGLLAVDQTDGSQFGLRLMTADHGLGSALLAVLSPLDHGVFTTDEIRRFAALFSLTPAETRVIDAVASGRTLDDFAADAMIQVDTARKQLKSAMAKAGCRSQKDLVRMVERFCFLSLR